ncbi:MAG: immunoglobulin-like domain-containing protein, partial [Candidatus Izemoplasmatales bacterium]
MFKKKVLAVVLCMTVMFLFGCDFFSPATTTKNTADTTDTTTVSTSEVTSTETDITLQLTYIYNLAVSTNAFTGTYEEWLESVRGPQGIPGKSVELQVAGGYVQWKYSDETTWKNLVEIASLKGEAGDSVLFQVTGEFIQWKYTNDTDWTNLLDLSTLSGPAGADGKDVTFQVADGYIQWKYLDDTVWTNLVDLIDLTGTDGREVEFNVSATHIQWRYAGETTWVDLVELAILTGADGETGTDGKQIELNVSSTIIQWRYVGDTEWIDLMDLTDLYGTVNNYFTDFALLHDLARNSDIYTVIGDIVCIYDTGYFLYDGVNVLHVYNPYHGLYEAGDRLEVTGHYTYYQGNWQISAITNEVLVSEGNPLTISPNEITLESMLNLSVYDKMTYAEYYSFTTVLDDYFYYYLETGTGISFNENISDELFDKLMQYGNLYGREVRFEGFIYRFLDANHIEFFINDFEVLDYRIYFETYGFDYIEPMFLKYNDPITTLPVPQAEGYSFLGWYLDEDFTTPFTLTTMPDFDLVLYAKFNRAPEIYGVEESFISLGSVFDPLFDVYAYDEEDGDLTSSIVYTGNIDVNAEGKYILTYSVTDSDGATSEVTRIINVVSSTVTYPTGYFNFKYATPELRLTFVAAAEKYLLNTMYGGVPLYANGTFDIYSDRILLPVDNYIPVMGYGAN